MGDLNVHSPQISVGTSEMCMSFRNLCSTHSIITKGYVKHVISVRLLFQGYKKMMQSPFLKVCHFVSLQLSQNTLVTTTLKQQYPRNAALYKVVQI